MPKVIERPKRGRSGVKQAPPFPFALAGKGTLTPSCIAYLMAGDPAAVPRDLVSTDTETSGLYADDGARVATASAAWVDWSGYWAAWADRITYREEPIAPGYSVPIVSVAWPFDQGVDPEPGEEPKAEFKGQAALDLFPSGKNLDRSEWVALLDWLASMRLVMHPLKFDCEKYRAGCRRWPGVGRDLEPMTDWDTQNVNNLIWPTDLGGLKATHERLFGPDYGDASKSVKAYLKKAKLPAGRWDLVPWDIIGPYADMDARMTKMIELRQRHDIEAGIAAPWLGDRVMEYVERRIETSRTLYRMERRGLPYHLVGSLDAAQDVGKVALGLAKKLPFAPNEAKDWYFKEGFKSKKTGEPGLGLVPYSMTEPSKAHPQGQPSMTEEILRRMIEDGVSHADAYANYQKIKVAQSMWYQGYADKTNPVDGRLRTCFRQNGTRSTRFSVERVNLQAIPQDYRMSGYSELVGVPSPRTLIAQAVALSYPDWDLWELDLAQAELRIGAMMAKCKSMLDMIRSGEDLHGVTAKALFNVDETSPDWGEKRQLGKRGNFSFMFGVGWKTYAAVISKETGIRLSERESRKIVVGWNALYPEYRRAIDRHARVVDSRMSKHGFGWVQASNGERRWFQPYEESHKAFNQRVQSSLAQFALDWMNAVERHLRRVAPELEQHGAGLLLPIHDSLVLLIPKKGGAERAEECAQIGRDLWAQAFPGLPGGVDTKRWKAAA